MSEQLMPAVLTLVVSATSYGIGDRYIEYRIDFQYKGPVLVLNRTFLRKDQHDITEAHMVSHQTSGLFDDVAMSVMHRNVTYNCRVPPLNSEVVIIRPKIAIIGPEGGRWRTCSFSGLSQR